MYSVQFAELNRKNFNSYGKLIEVPVGTKPDIKTDTVQFWKQQAIIAMGESIEVGVLKVKKQEMIFNELENHFNTPTILISLDGDFIIPLAPVQDEIPSADKVVAFKVPKFQMLVLAEKCWHGTTYPVDQEEITLLVIFKKNSLENDTVYEKLDQDCKVVY